MWSLSLRGMYFCQDNIITSWFQTILKSLSETFLTIHYNITVKYWNIQVIQCAIVTHACRNLASISGRFTAPPGGRSSILSGTAARAQSRYTNFWPGAARNSRFLVCITIYQSWTTQTSSRFQSTGKVEEVRLKKSGNWRLRESW